MGIASVRLPGDLKEAVGELARLEGKTPHAFMLEAIEEKIEAARRRQAFLAEGIAALEDYTATGESIGAEDMHRWMRSKARGESAEVPRARRRQR